jgi:hypothetical protein
MSRSDSDFDIFDPTGMLKKIRNENMDAWSKTMVQLVNSDAYAEATAKLLDAWLSGSAPFRKLLDGAMTQALESLHLPSRDDVTRLAERLTNIEMRLDDLDAKLDGFTPPQTPATAGA